MTDIAPSLLERLSEPFDPSVVRKNENKFHYLPIDVVYNRLDEVMGESWSLTIVRSEVGLVPREQLTYGRKDKTGFMGIVHARITYYPPEDESRPVHRDGVGSDYADDPDKVIKTALANAVKKAANGFGVGRYLWNAEERAAIDDALAAKNDTRQLKQRVVELYESTKGTLEGTPAEKQAALAEHFGVAVEDLASAETLNKILEA